MHPTPDKARPAPPLQSVDPIPLPGPPSLPAPHGPTVTPPITHKVSVQVVINDLPGALKVRRADGLVVAILRGGASCLTMGPHEGKIPKGQMVWS